MEIGSTRNAWRRFVALAAACVLAGWVSVAGVPPARALSGGTEVPDGSYGFIARLEMSGARACTGTLISPLWVITAKSCFADDAGSVVAGPPPMPTTVTFAGAGQSAPAGRMVTVASIVVHPDRDIVLAKLSLQITDIAPIAVGGTAPAAGDQLQAAGYGRTATEWVPDRPHSAPVTVATVTTGSFAWTGQATACKGDAGGPVFRDSGGRPELVGLDIASAQGGCLGEPDGEHGATAVRLDDVKAWTTANIPGLTGAFAASFASGSGIGGFSLADPRDQVVAFDYDHSGKQDHLLLYRPGQGAVYILKHGPDNSYTRVYATADGGIGGYDMASAADRIVPFDFDHSGKLDHLVAYRPGSKTVFILKHEANNTFSRVYANNTAGIGGFSLADSRDQVVAFDYDHSGKQDHLLLYRPVQGAVFILKHGPDNTYTRVYATADGGIGGYDLAAAADRIVPFDYDHNGAQDHLVLYRPQNRRSSAGSSRSRPRRRPAHREAGSCRPAVAAPTWRPISIRTPTASSPSSASNCSRATGTSCSTRLAYLRSRSARSVSSRWRRC